MIYAQLAAGFIYLLGGGDLLVRGAVGLARRFRVAPVLVALTVVAFGTSLPELMVSIQASVTGYPNLILGNVVGSNIANILLVGGSAAAVFPLRMRGPGVRWPGAGMLAVTLVFAGICISGHITQTEGWILLGGFGVVLALMAREALGDHQQPVDATPIEWVLGVPSSLPFIAMFIGIGVVTLPLGADLLVDSAVEIAGRLGVTETVIGLTIVAIGTSLPEIATTLIAAMRRRTGMAVGTIIGSNTFNLLAIMGIAGVISPSPVPVSERFLSLDVPVMIGASAALVVYAWLGRAIGRKTGVALLSTYVVYLVVLYLTL